MRKQDIEERMKSFIELMQRERILKEELLAMRLQEADKKDMEKKLVKHDQIIEKIENIRQKEMIPILDELLEFIASKKQSSM